MAVHNVSSLAKRIHAMTSWEAHVHVCTEVRASSTSVRSLSRSLSGLGFASVWSAPPPRGATFEVPPGGVAICARKPLFIKQIKAPDLHRWESQGRLVAARIMMDSEELIVVGIYGFPPSHDNRRMNEDFFAQVFIWARGLRTPVVIAGDFNHTVSTSRTLSLAPTMGLWKVSPNDPTTRSKKGGASTHAAIDHVFGNYRLLDMRPHAHVDTTKWLSDHYPIILSVDMPKKDLHVWHWPKPMKLGRRRERVQPWRSANRTYGEWLAQAQTWLAENHDCLLIPKDKVTTSVEASVRPKIDEVYSLILSAQRALGRILDKTGDVSTRRKLQRKFDLLQIPYSDDDDDEENARSLDLCLANRLNHVQESTLKKWRDGVATWHAHDSQLYRYLRNVLPAKSIMLRDEDHAWTADPAKMYTLLNRYWMQVESWPPGASVQMCLDILDDRYSMFLPRCEGKMHLTVKDITYRVRVMKKSAPGPDSWTKEEMVALPAQAWEDLLSIWDGDTCLAATGLMWYRRVPIEKQNEDGPSPSDIRPIDVFSKITRAFSSAHVSGIRAWLKQVLLPTQFASHGGIEKAVASMNRYVEAILHRIHPVWAISVDFAKLFNTISPEVAAETCKLMGMDSRDIRRFMRPLVESRGVWRLPRNALCPWSVSDRGLPQGLSISVALSEVFLSILLYRVHTIVPSASICYVDDLNFVTKTREDLLRVMSLLWQFVQDFALQLSLQKTQVWGSDSTSIACIAEEWGVKAGDSLDALGVTWGLLPSAKPLYHKEKQRVNDCMERLTRLLHLPASIQVKMTAARVGCLSLIAYAPPPKLQMVSRIQQTLKKALSTPYDAPEILLLLLPSSPLDPTYLWALGLLKMMNVCYGVEGGPDLIRRIKLRKTHSRFAALAKHLKGMGWELRDARIVVSEEVSLALGDEWGVLKERFTRAYNLWAMSKLERRRPSLYMGIQSISKKHHMKLLTKVGPYKASVLLRAWSGSAMTRAHRHTINRDISPKCGCGYHTQTLSHLLYHCPLVPKPSFEISAWQHLPPACSASLLLLLTLPLHMTEVWRQVCMRAIDVLSNQAVMQGEDHDWKGHTVHTSSDGCYAYCTRCMVTRKLRDAKFVSSKPCVGDIWGNMCCEGEYMVLQPHLVRMSFSVWKKDARRPKASCAKCGASWWPGSAIPRFCVR